MDEDPNQLEKTYSRDRSYAKDGLEHETTPVALVRSVTQRSRPGEASLSGRIPTIKDFDTASYMAESYMHKEGSSPSTPITPVEEDGGDGVATTPRKTIRFEDGDPENPNNWPRWKKMLAFSVAMMSVMNSTMSSSLAAGATEPISRHFSVTSESQLILPTSIYLVGYAGGPMIWGPISESYGRKWTITAAFVIFTVFSIASAVSPNFASLVVFRFLVGIGGSCAISVVGGICADVYHDPVYRGRSMAIFMAATTFGPILGPPISGFVSVVSWSWAFWVGAIFAGATWPLFFFFPETYGPTILKHRAQRLRKETGDESIVAPIELEKTDFGHIVTVVLTRPLRMICFEPLVLFTCLYLSYAYAIFYIYFQSYPLIFTDIYGFNAGETGLAFLPIGVGAVISAVIYLSWDAILLRAQAAQRPWSRKEEMRRLPLACIAGPFFVVSSFWLGWTARASIHWSAPCLAGILFGMGYLCLFMALLNYLVDAYAVFAASAMAAASLMRSCFGAVLPFAAKPMYRALGIPWASSLLGFCSLALCVIPFVFLRWGGRMREKSKFCQYLMRKKREEEEEREKEREQERREGAMDAGSGDKGKEEV